MRTFTRCGEAPRLRANFAPATVRNEDAKGGFLDESARPLPPGACVGSNALCRNRELRAAAHVGQRVELPRVQRVIEGAGDVADAVREEVVERDQ